MWQVSLVASVLFISSISLVAESCPSTISGCSCSGENIRCYNQGLKSVPRVPSNTRLLDLRFNNITKLSENDFTKLFSLRTLLLQHNEIEQIDSRAFRPLANLEVLYMSHNLMTKLPFNLFIFLRGVRIIHLDANRISDIHEDAFNGLTSLTTLYLHQNDVSRVSRRAFSLPQSLTTLRLDGNPLFCNCQIGWTISFAPLNNVYRHLLSCGSPESFRGRLILNLTPATLGCSVPRASVTRSQVTVTERQALTLHCTATGEPHPIISWTHNNINISNTTRIQVMSNGTLLVKGITHSDRGEYKCEAINLMGRSVSTVFVSYLGDPVPPEIFSHTNDSEVRRGDTATLYCVAHGHPAPVVTWLKDNQVLSSNRKITQPTANSLKLSDIQFRDGGVYTCQASNSQGIDQEDIRLTVVAPPLIEQTSVANVLADPGENVVLTCQVTGKPTPLLSWTFDDNEINAGSRHVISGDQLEIRLFRSSDQGSYSCIASNKLGIDKRTFTVFMKRLLLPVYTTSPQSQYVLVGNTLVLTCMAVGTVAPNQWILNGTALASRGRVTISRSGDRLTIRNVTFDDSGAYQCFATGKDGNLLSNPANITVTNDVISCDDISQRVGIQQIANQVDTAIRNTNDRMMGKQHFSPSDLLTLLKFPSSGTVDLAKATEIFDEAIQRFESNFTSGDDVVNGIPLHLNDCELTVLARLSGCVSHQPAPNCSDACFHRRYRTYDGTCNNLRYPLRGAAMTPFGRLLDADYDNDLSLPRGWVQSLPSPREVSHDVLSSRGKELREDFSFTLMMMQMGQFIDHDLDLAPITPSRESFEHGMSCEETCENTSPCFPIPVSVNDRRIRNKECLPFTRSSAVCGTGASSLLVGRAAYRREQINQITSYIDASQIYGSSLETADLLRNRSSGRGFLRRGEEFSPGLYYLPYDTTSVVDCDQGINAGRSLCFLSGDIRVNEQVGLTVMHTVWYREHNRVTRLLSELNPHWDDERSYQEARLIVTAEWQHVVFTEYVPKVVGVAVWDNIAGDYEDYDDTVDVSILNSFATAAFRFGHSQIMPMLLRLNETWQPTEHGHLPLFNAFFAPHRIVEEGGIDPLLRGLMFEQSKERASDQALSDVITEQLFLQANNVSLDLGALNIQRGRDHGLPSYNRFREYCGLTVARNFRDLSRDISGRDARRRLEQIYDDVDDIDLFVGGLLEDLLPGSRLGPTFACILTTQFLRLRDGDRFYYEKPGLFTPDQLREIKKTSLAKVICNNADNITTIPSDVFVHQPVHQFVSCDELDTPDLFYWMDCQDCNKNEHRRDISSPVFDIGNPQFNTAYEQLQSTVQLLSDKMAGLEKSTCNFNGVIYSEGEYWELSECHNCECQDGEVICEHIGCNCDVTPHHKCCPECSTSPGNV